MKPSRLPVALAQAAGDCISILRVFFGKQPGSGVSRPETAVVMGAQVVRNGKPSTTLRARTLHAARMYEAGEVREILVTGGLGQYPPEEAAVMSGLLLHAGVPEADILRESSARSTWESAVYVSEMLRARGICEITVVTDPLHCERTVAAFRECGTTAVAEPVYGSPSWRVRKMRLGQLVREMGASFWYRIHHGVGSRTPRW